jgi:hypothetical protein
MSPATSLAVGVVLILIGFLIPFLMVLRILESGLVLTFSAYGASLVGLVLSLYGVSRYRNGREGDES